ncbi:MAG TPA: LacI family DNA-binding transcriptional regulator [Acetobacteraceae bacterium]|jgi:LacI family gluconate utilization system Gnt-I transcriptional repressor|nr:LacI family DNA-binding transcriptional regulator [Acetobacteraceae bacterium]
MAIKITDVAAAAGVAPMTVSRVLNTPERVSAATAARVRDAIDTLGYVPNLIAGGLSSRRSRMIAAIVPTIASPMFSEPVQSFTDVMGRAGYNVLLGLSGYGEGEDALIRAVLSRRPDGLLLTGASHPPSVRKLLNDARVPVVEIWDNADAATDMLVGFDHAEVGATVADFFADCGHTHYAGIGARDPRAGLRRAGFLERVAARGGTLVAERVLSAPSTALDGRRAMAEIADGLPPRTAIFCSSDLVAFGVITEARVRGLDVPGRVAVCGFGDFELSRASVPSITTVSVDGAAMGRLAAENLLGRLDGRAAGPPHGHRVMVPFHIITRESS